MINKGSDIKDNQHYFKSEEFWELSNLILELASNGYSRAEFLKDISQLLLQLSGSDVIDLVIFDGGRQFLCRSGPANENNYQFEEVPYSKDQKEIVTWSADKNGAIEILCRDIVNKRFDPSKSCFTKDGSFWANNLDNIGIPALQPSETDKELGMNIHRKFQSVVIIPIDVGQKRIGLLELRSKAGNFYDKQQIYLYEQVARIIGSALSHRRLQVALRERVKELTCLYGIAKLVQQPGISRDYLLQEIVKLLPPAWLYPEIASAQIAFDDLVYISSKFGKAVHTMKADIVIRKEIRGFVEIRYSTEQPQLDDGPFLIEERNLIDTIAQEISIITEQMQAEEEKIKLQDQLRHSDRLATIGQLVASVTHELNEPLSNVLGFAQLVIKDPNLTEQTKQDISKIIEASLHAREVIKKLLTSAKDTPIIKKRMNFNYLIESGLYFFKSRCAKSGIEIVSNLQRGLPDLIADRPQMMQVFTNLVVNATQAMPHGGRLTITTKEEDGYIFLIIEDTGIGMTEKVLKKVFDPFFTTKDTDQGTGLGLSIVHGIVTSHGGEIIIDSKVGSGSKFIIKIPENYANSYEDFGNE
ncbi:MAG: ATP-binding protein [bacterium]